MWNNLCSLLKYYQEHPSERSDESRNSHKTGFLSSFLMNTLAKLPMLKKTSEVIKWIFLTSEVFLNFGSLGN